MSKRCEVRCLRQKTQEQGPFWVSYLPAGWRERYILRHRPYVVTEEGEQISISLQTDGNSCYLPVWREAAQQALQEAKASGAVIAVSPLAADLPQDILPFADGRRLTALFAGEGVAEALRRMGKDPHACRLVVADGNGVQAVLATLPENINHLGVWTDRAEEFMVWQEEMLEERGLVTEVFASLGHAAFRSADAVISCAKDGKGMVYAFAKQAFCLDLGANCGLLHNVTQQRQDVQMADGLCFSIEQGHLLAADAEAWAYCKIEAFRTCFHNWTPQTAKEAKAALIAAGVRPIGLQLFGKRCKIRKIAG